MGFTDGLGVSDVVTVALVTVAPDPPAETPAPSPPEATPTETAAEATIEQTGAGPPPDGRS